MEHTGIELFRGRKMPYTGDERLPERAIIGPFGKDFVDGRIVDIIANKLLRLPAVNSKVV